MRRDYINFGLTLDAEGNEVNGTKGTIWENNKRNLYINARERHNRRKGGSQSRFSSSHKFFGNKNTYGSVLFESTSDKSLITSKIGKKAKIHKDNEILSATESIPLGSLNANRLKSHQELEFPKKIMETEMANDVHTHKGLVKATLDRAKSSKIRFSWKKKIETGDSNSSNRKGWTSFLRKQRRSIREINIPGEAISSGDEMHLENGYGRGLAVIRNKQIITFWNESDTSKNCNDHEGNDDDSNTTEKLQNPHSAQLSSLVKGKIKNDQSDNRNEILKRDLVIYSITDERQAQSCNETFPLEVSDLERSEFFPANLERRHNHKAPRQIRNMPTYNPSKSVQGKKGHSIRDNSSFDSIKGITSKRSAAKLLDTHSQHFDNKKKSRKKFPVFEEHKNLLGLAPRDEDSGNKIRFHQLPQFTSLSKSKNLKKLSSQYNKHFTSFYSPENFRNLSRSPVEVNEEIDYAEKVKDFPILVLPTSENNKSEVLDRDSRKKLHQEFSSGKFLESKDNLTVKSKVIPGSPQASLDTEQSLAEDGGYLYPYKAKDNSSFDVTESSVSTQNITFEQNQINHEGYRKRREVLGFPGNIKLAMLKSPKMNNITLFRRKRNINSEENGILNADTYDTVNNTQKKEATCPKPNEFSNEGVNRTMPQGMDRVHSAEMTVTIIVKDINDNPPVFPNVTMFGEIQENGPAELSVAQVSAWDNDDATEGTNARITYFIEKNVIHDRTGEAIFDVHPKSGLITTAICCLDRETTPEYYIQVVAADGGGLKGTGTVLVRLRDENDNPPHLARKSWDLEIVETYGEGPPHNQTLLEMTVGDPDATNHFSFRIVKDSGPGWDRFGIRSSGSSGQLFALKKLDYEDEGHRQGFRFMVQVTDRGEEGWEDPRHQDSAWVSVKLKDRNDNPPHFKNSNVHLAVSESTAPGTLLLNMTATDPDKGKGGQVKYQVAGLWDTLRMDDQGSITLYRSLDRESDDEVEKVFRILAMDQGDPPLTSTGTLTITVTDVNDCPPRLLPPTVLHVQEGEPPSLLGILTATDDDVWSLGHGPPFRMSLAPSNSRNILNLVQLKFFQHLDSGRGGAEIWTRGSLDREANRELPVKVLIWDSGNLNNTQIVPIVVGDVNDNPMKAASKTVYLWKTPNSGSEAPLGRVYVDDPDDWDVGDKTFRWAGKPHPLFTLNSDDGTIYASSQVREGRYFLQFGVSDHVWKQVDVSANVTVIVRVLTHDALTHATPVFLSPTTPADLTRGWIPSVGGGSLGKLIKAVQEIKDLDEYKIEVVSVYGTDTTPDSATFLSLSSGVKESDPYSLGTRNPRNSIGQSSQFGLSSYACVWLSVMDYQGLFMDPVRLQGLLALHSKHLEDATGFIVTFNNPSADLEQGSMSNDRTPAISPHSTLGKEESILGSSEYLSTSTLKYVNEEGPGGVASMASTLLPLQVVDTNLTSLVTPHLLRSHECPTKGRSSSSTFKSSSTSCTSSSCLNGGRCVTYSTESRCVCPGGSKGPQCKIYSRTFRGNGWVWLKPPSSCLPMSISLRVLTTKPDGLLLYNGPLTPPSAAARGSSTVMIAVQLVNRRPQVLIQSPGEALKLEVNKSASDGDWHTIYLRLDTFGASMMMDICGFERRGKLIGDSRCVARQTWRNRRTIRMWESISLLQIGGIAQPHPRSTDFGWQESVTPHFFDGCLSHLTINDQVMDLGEPSFSKGSSPRCQMQDSACSNGDGACQIHSECTGGLWNPKCQCDPGWSGENCDTPTIPTTLGLRSYIKVALSFTPPSQHIVIQARVRSLGFKTGVLMHLVSQQTNSSLTLHLQSGVACASMSVAGWTAKAACVNGHPIGDGKWHTIRAERHGHNLLAIVDDGDNGSSNYSFPSLVTHIHERIQKVKGPPVTLQIDKHDGVTIGGLPHLMGVSLLGVEQDLTETCIDDVRISDRQLPLPPAVNGSSWGQVTNSDGLIEGCQPPSSCLNVTCKHPLSCHPAWPQPTCSCGLGRHYINHACSDVDECLHQPCLHGGTCVNLHPGYECLCPPNYLGDNCEWVKVTGATHHLSAHVIIASVTSSLLLLVLLGILFSFRHRRLRAGKKDAEKEIQDDEPLDKTSLKASKTDAKVDSKASKDRDTGRKKKKKKEDKALSLESEPTEAAGKEKGPEDQSHTTFLQLLKLSRTQSKKDLNGCDGREGVGVSVKVITTSGGTVREGVVGVLQSHPHPVRQNHIPGEDLRSYAYEGDGSSSGSLTSTISGLQAEVERDESSSANVASEFLEVIDLLQNLPDAPRSSSLLSRMKQKERTENITQGHTLRGDQMPLMEHKSARTSSDVSAAPSASSSLDRSSKGRRLLHISREKMEDLKTTAC